MQKLVNIIYPCNTISDLSLPYFVDICSSHKMFISCIITIDCTPNYLTKVVNLFIIPQMKRIFLALSVLLLVSAFTLQQSPSSKPFSPSNLGFDNTIGPGFTKQMENHAKNLINAASGYYKDDVAQNIAYIKQRMDKGFGTSNQQFYVFIQDRSPAIYNWYVYLDSQYIYAELSQANIVYPEWSYFIYRNTGTPGKAFTYLKPWTVGPGITDQHKRLINNVVNTYEPNGECTCSAVQQIGDALIAQTGYLWNTVCDEHGITEAQVKTVHGLWGTFQPKNCYYSLYVHS